MRNLQTFEAFSLLPKYFSKESRELRNKKNIIKEKLKKLMEDDVLSVNNTIYQRGSNVTPVYKPKRIEKKANKYGRIGNTFIKANNDRYGYFDINDDLTIDVYGSVYIENPTRGRGLEDIKFNMIVGDFKTQYSFNEFDHFPEIVYGDLVVKDCGLDSFKQLPTKMVYCRKLDVSGNNLTSFEGMPELIPRSNVANITIDITSNDIYSLEFFPNNPNIDDVESYLNPIINIRLSYEGDENVDGGYRDFLSFLLNDIRERGGYEFDLYLEYDPIHPSDGSSGKRTNGVNRAILYLDRMNAFLTEVGFKPLEVTKQLKHYYKVIE